MTDGQLWTPVEGLMFGLPRTPQGHTNTDADASCIDRDGVMSGAMGAYTSSDSPSDFSDQIGRAHV